MRAGHFNLNEYLSKLNESQEAGSVNGEGIIIPDGESKKAYDWLKKEYSKGKTEVKVEMKLGTQKFEPSMDFQTKDKSTNNFKSGLFGDVKTSDTEGNKKKEESSESEDQDSSDKKDFDKETSESSEETKPKKKVAAPMKITATSKKV